METVGSSTGTRCWRIGLDTALGGLSSLGWKLFKHSFKRQQKLQDLPAGDVCSVKQVPWCREGAGQHCFILPWQLAHHSGWYWFEIWSNLMEFEMSKLTRAGAYAFEQEFLNVPFEIWNMIRLGHTVLCTSAAERRDIGTKVCSCMNCNFKVVLALSSTTSFALPSVALYRPRFHWSDLMSNEFGYFH